MIFYIMIMMQYLNVFEENIDSERLILRTLQWNARRDIYAAVILQCCSVFP